jgi:hypothetical protein
MIVLSALVARLTPLMGVGSAQDIGTPSSFTMAAPAGWHRVPLGRGTPTPALTPEAPVARVSTSKSARPRAPLIPRGKASHRQMNRFVPSSSR